MADQLFVNSSLEGLTLSSYKRNEKIPSIFMKICFCSFGFFLFFKKNILIKKHITSNYKNFFYSLSRGLPVSIFFWLIAYMVKKKNIERNDYIENVLILMIYIYRSIFCINEKKLLAMMI